MITPAVAVITATLLTQPLSERIIICSTIEPMNKYIVCEPGATWFNGVRGDCVVCTRHKRYEDDRQ